MQNISNAILKYGHSETAIFISMILFVKILLLLSSNRQITKHITKEANITNPAFCLTSD